MDNQINKFATVCAIFDIKVFDENAEYVKLVKGSFEMRVSKVCISNDYHLIKSLYLAYSEFSEAEHQIVRESEE